MVWGEVQQCHGVLGLVEERLEEGCLWVVAREGKRDRRGRSRRQVHGRGLQLVLTIQVLELDIRQAGVVRVVQDGRRGGEAGPNVRGHVSTDHVKEG